MRWLALLGGLWLAATPPLTAPPAGKELGIGSFLIANRQVSGFFEESVIVLVDHGENGSLGLIVNRPVEVTLAQLLPEVEAAHGRSEHAWLGGPVAPDHLLILIHAKQAPADSAHVLDGLHVSGSSETLRKLLIEPAKGVEFRAYIGYAGWAPGQLAGEIARGDWTLAPGDADSVFARDPSGLWEKLLRRNQEIEVRARCEFARASAWEPPTGPVPRSEAQPSEAEARAPELAWPTGAVPRSEAQPSEAESLVAAPAKSINLSRPWRSAAASSVCPTSARARSSTR